MNKKKSYPVMRVIKFSMSEELHDVLAELFELAESSDLFNSPTERNLQKKVREVLEKYNSVKDTEELEYAKNIIEKFNRKYGTFLGEK